MLDKNQKLLSLIKEIFSKFKINVSDNDFTKRKNSASFEVDYNYFTKTLVKDYTKYFISGDYNQIDSVFCPTNEYFLAKLNGDVLYSLSMNNKQNLGNISVFLSKGCFNNFYFFKTIRQFHSKLIEPNFLKNFDVKNTLQGDILSHNAIIYIQDKDCFYHADNYKENQNIEVFIDHIFKLKNRYLVELQVLESKMENFSLNLNF